jgi:hypothetical protein
MADEMVTVPRDLVLLALSFAPKDAPPGLDPTFYFTNTHKGDAEIVARLNQLRDVLSPDQKESGNG